MNNIIDFLTCSTCLVLASLQTNEVFKMIQLILTIILISINIIERLIKWYKKAKEDKKITIDEVQELVDIVEEEINKIDIKEE